MKTVAIIDYGMGNLHSAKKAVEHVAPDTTVLVTDNAQKIREADRVILPGVGAIRDCMAEMHRFVKSLWTVRSLVSAWASRP